MPIRNLLLILSSIFGFITPYIGFHSIYRGEYKPQRITRFVIFISEILFVSTLYFQGDTTGIYLAILQSIGGALIFLLSFKYGVGGFAKSDIVVLFLALITLLVWYLTKDPTLALYLSITADFIGFIPTIIKSYKEPYTEDWKFYISDVFASGLSLIAISSFIFKDFVFSLYIFVINLFIALVIIYQRKRIPASISNQIAS